MKAFVSKQFCRLFVVTIFIFGVISLAGCVKKLPPPSEGSNTLLVIPTEVVNKTPIERKYNYIMKFERKPESGRWNDDATETDQNGSRFFSKMVNLKRDGKSLFLVYEMPPGEYRLYSIREEPINVTNAQSITSKLKQKPFILEEKKIVIYPRKVAYKQELIGASKWPKPYEPIQTFSVRITENPLSFWFNQLTSITSVLWKFREHPDNSQTNPMDCRNWRLFRASSIGEI